MDGGGTTTLEDLTKTLGMTPEEERVTADIVRVGQLIGAHYTIVQRSPIVDEADTTQNPVLKLVGEDGDVSGVIGNVRRALTDAGRPDDAQEFVGKAFAAGSYDEMLRLVLATVEGK